MLSTSGYGISCIVTWGYGGVLQEIEPDLIINVISKITLGLNVMGQITKKIDIVSEINQRIDVDSFITKEMIDPLESHILLDIDLHSIIEAE